MARNGLGEVRGILSALARSGNDRARQGELATTLGALPDFEPSNLPYEFKRVPKGAEQAVSGVIMGPPVEHAATTIYPVFLLGLISPHVGEPGCWLRVALFTSDKVKGWRFEPPDRASDRGHRYWHAQRIIGWYKNRAGFDNFLPPTNDEDRAAGDDVFCVRPAIPLPCKSPATLVVAAIVAVYGSTRTEEILEGYTPKPREIDKEIAELIDVGY